MEQELIHGGLLQAGIGRLACCMHTYALVIWFCFFIQRVGPQAINDGMIEIVGFWSSTFVS